MLVQVIENNLLLHQLIDTVDNILEKQETNHLVAIALRDHNTIDKVEQLWQGFANIRFLLWILAAAVGTIPITAGVLTATHVIWHWPG